MSKKKIMFVTGTRADFGKLKSLIRIVESSKEFDIYIFVTGMHMLSKYGSTVNEIEKENYKNIYKFINQTESVPMDIILSNTIEGISNYVNEIKPDLIIVHGDRVEALAGAIVGALRNILVAHIEGGEVSGTIDELIRHSISKLAHTHFVSNCQAKKRLIQMGEDPNNVFEIGSPDLDIMLSENLPIIEEAKKRYEIPYDDYSIFAYHPVTTEIEDLQNNITEVLEALILSNRNYIVIYPNNDLGSGIIFNEIDRRLGNNSRFKIFPSIRFEYFLTLLKFCDFMIGNSSAGIRETEVYGKASINIGTRQNGRYLGKNIINVDENKEDIVKVINEAVKTKNTVESKMNFGNGNSCEEFYNIITKEEFWNIPKQKYFIDR